MDMAAALAGLGVTATTIDAATTEWLDRDGYVPLPGVLSAPQVEAIRDRLAGLLAAEGERAGLEVHREAGADRLADLINKGPVFEPCFTDPRVLARVAHVLGDLKLSSLNSRAALPGQGRQGLHADFGGPVPADGYQVCNSIWLLDDFTADNGATRVVPGSHRAGSVVVFNSHLWHGGTLNRTGAPRRALHSYFTRWSRSQQLNQKKYIRPQTLARLSPAARFILDV